MIFLSPLATVGHGTDLRFVTGVKPMRNTWAFGFTFLTHSE
jgi:hypothetical protein